MHPQTEIMSRIGALELGAVAAAPLDATLEATCVAGPQGPLTGIPGHPICRHIEALDDAALEATRVANPPTGIPGHPMCRHIGDTELEASALQAGPPFTSPMSGCRHIDDSGLEHAADGVFAGPKTIIFPGSNTRCV
jgi:hypothetical protein